MDNKRLSFDELPIVNSERWMDLTDLENEHWKKIEIDGIPDGYYVSDYGRITDRWTEDPAACLVN